MDLTRQAETMIDLLSSSHTEEDDIYQIFNLSRGSSLYAAWLWDGILLWGNEIRLDKLSYPMSPAFLRVSEENDKTKTGKYSIINKYPYRINTYRASIRLW